MGTHISKVKSVDLDMWTPEQMAVSLGPLSGTFRQLTYTVQSIQKWGNKRANLYWEAHLKPGHQPPDQCVFSVSAGMQTNITSFYSKLDSFIRSKYESRRWAMEGPPPADPSTLESSTPAESSTAAMSDSVASISPPHPPSVTSPSSAPVVTTTVPVVASRTQHQLLSAQHKRIPSIPKPIAAAPLPWTFQIQHQPRVRKTTSSPSTSHLQRHLPLQPQRKM